MSNPPGLFTPFLGNMTAAMLIAVALSLHISVVWLQPIDSFDDVVPLADMVGNCYLQVLIIVCVGILYVGNHHKDSGVDYTFYGGF